MSFTINNSIPVFKKQKISNGVSVSYREVGDSDKPNLLLLHGFPTSSRQYHDLMILLSPYFHIIAPDLPFYGQTETPDNFPVSFEALASTIESFLELINFDNFTVYVFDYGAPTGYRIAINGKRNIKAIISQNGNAYESGLGDGFWSIFYKAWELADAGKQDSEEYKKEHQNITEALKGYDAYGSQYTTGEPDQSRINAESGLIDYHLLYSTGSIDKAVKNQVDLIIDYRNNIILYPKFHDFFQKSQVPILAIWGANDDIFLWEGAESYKKDSSKLKLVKIEGGHFAGVTHVKEVAVEILKFHQEFDLF